MNKGGGWGVRGTPQITRKKKGRKKFGGGKSKLIALAVWGKGKAASGVNGAVLVVGKRHERQKKKHRWGGSNLWIWWGGDLIGKKSHGKRGEQMKVG